MVSRDNPDFLSASTLKGDKVINGSGDEIGKIEELMIDLQDGRVGYAVLSLGGFLGMGDKLFAIPWKALQLRIHKHKFLLDIPKEVLENAEGFDKDKWPLTNRQFVSSIYGYYGYQTYWQTKVQRGESEGIDSQTGSMEAGDNPEFLSSGTIKGNKVVNRDGGHNGRIEELMIDLQDGKVAYTVVSHGGILGIGIRSFAIPWQALSLRFHEHVFILDIPEETFDKAESFDKNRWPITREELTKTYTYYGYQPYWRGEVEEQAGISTGMQGETEL